MKVTQSCLTLCQPTDCSLPGSSVHGILQARILEQVAVPFSRGLFSIQGSNPGLLHRQADSLPSEPSGSPSLLPAGLGLRCTGSSLVQGAGVSLRCLLLLRSTGSRVCHSSSCSAQAPELRLNDCGTRAQLLCGTWDLPRSGIKLQADSLPLSHQGRPQSFPLWVSLSCSVYITTPRVTRLLPQCPLEISYVCFAFRAVSHRC